MERGSEYLEAAQPAPIDGAAQPHNLPVALTAFIGREREVATVRRLLGYPSTRRLPRVRTLAERRGCKFCAEM